MLSRFPWCGICMLVLILAGCKVKRPDSVLSESKMENILYDYHLAQAMGDNVPYNENYKKALYIDAVFEKYGTTEAVFDSSMVWYTRNTDILSKVYERVSKRLKSQQETLNNLVARRDRKAGITLPGDSIDIWSEQRILRLTGTPLDNKITFSIASDSNFKERDTLLWKVRYRFPEGTPDSLYSAVMALQVVYKNDSVIGQAKKIRKTGLYTIRLESDTLGEIKEVRGFIYYPGGKKLVPLLTDHISLTRYHQKAVVMDSLATDSLKTDSLRKDSIRLDSVRKIDTDTTTQVQPQEQQRLRPDEMNRPRTGNRPAKRSTQSSQPTQSAKPTPSTQPPIQVSRPPQNAVQSPSQPIQNVRRKQIEKESSIQIQK